MTKAEGTGHRGGVARGSGVRMVPRFRAFGAHYPQLLLSLFSVVVAFSILDLFLTNIALGLGLSESNYFLYLISEFSGLNILGALGLTKIIFVGAGAAATMIGFRSGNSALRKRVFLLMLFLAILLITTAMNNLYWIGTAG